MLKNSDLLPVQTQLEASNAQLAVEPTPCTSSNMTSINSDASFPTSSAAIFQNIKINKKSINIPNVVASNLSQFQYKKASKLTLNSSSPRKHLEIVIDDDDSPATPSTNMKTSTQLSAIKQIKNETPNSLCVSPISGGSISKKRQREALFADSNVDSTLRDKDSNVTDIFMTNPKRSFQREQLNDEEKEQIIPVEKVCLDQSSNEELDFMNDESSTDKSMKTMNISDETKEEISTSNSSFRRFNFKPKVSKIKINCYNCGIKVCDYLPNANESISESFIKCLPNQVTDFLESEPKNLRIITDQTDENCFEANCKLSNQELERSVWKFYNCKECLSLIGCMPVYSEGKNAAIVNSFKNKIVFLSQN